MREDYLEALEKMFPQGFILIYRVDNEKRHLKFAITAENDNPYLIILWNLIQQFIKEWRNSADSEQV